METDETSPVTMKNALSKKEQENLPEDIRTKYEQFFSEFLEMKALYETQRSSIGEYIIAHIIINIKSRIRLSQCNNFVKFSHRVCLGQKSRIMASERWILKVQTLVCYQSIAFIINLEHTLVHICIFY